MWCPRPAFGTAVDMEWTDVTPTQARGQGQIATSTCEPNCAEGISQNYPATFVLSEPTREFATEPVYTLMKISFTGEAPSEWPQTRTYRLSGYVGYDLKTCQPQWAIVASAGDESRAPGEPCTVGQSLPEADVPDD